MKHIAMCCSTLHFTSVNCNRNTRGAFIKELFSWLTISLSLFFLDPTGAVIVRMVYYLSANQLFQIFTQFLDAIDVREAPRKDFR